MILLAFRHGLRASELCDYNGRRWTSEPIRWVTHDEARRGHCYRLTPIRDFGSRYGDGSEHAGVLGYCRAPFGVYRSVCGDFG
jgi:hypothetical protein